jgi:hypothetical protein
MYIRDSLYTPPEIHYSLDHACTGASASYSHALMPKIKNTEEENNVYVVFKEMKYPRITWDLAGGEGGGFHPFISRNLD